ncbi:MAG TPA: hypothetical protein VGN84_07965 [Solirubrobacterales bacterium]|nr:hypothetical protein [Solirubrobacterales bacterium]
MTIKAKAVQPKTAAAVSPAPAIPVSTIQESWFRRHRNAVLFGGGLFAVLVLAFIVSFVVLGLFDTGEATAREALTSSTATFERSSAETGAALTAPLPFTALSEAASASKGRAGTISETIADLTEKVDEESLVKPSSKALKAERRFLTRFSQISTFPESELEHRWKRLKPELLASQQSINSSRRAVLALGLGDTAHLLPANVRISAMIDSASKIILLSNQKVQQWRSERDAAKTQLASAESYKSEMSNLMGEYYSQRNITQELVHEQHVYWQVAEEQLLSQASERGGIIEGMNALLVPAGAESAHSQMVSLATQSKGLLEEAATAAREEPDIIWTGSPGWQRLSTESEAITQQFASAESAVLAAAEGAIASEQAKLSQVGPKPQL